jgi:outer membrane receptor protein involved in Fe transport
MWMPMEGLNISASVAYYDSELQDEYDGGAAPKGAPLPLTPDFKGNMVARYEFPFAGFDANVQGALMYETSRPSNLDTADNDVLGDIPSRTVFDLSGGIGRDSWALDLFVSNLTNEDAPIGISTQCNVGICGVQSYGIRTAPRTIGIRFSQEF